MKGHKFDWRVKRRPPFRVFLLGDIGGPYEQVGGRIMVRCPTPKRDPMVRWLGKRGTVRFIAMHGVRF